MDIVLATSISNALDGRELRQRIDQIESQLVVLTRLVYNLDRLAPSLPLTSKKYNAPPTDAELRGAFGKNKMQIEACNIIQLHSALQRAFPQTQFLWQPSHEPGAYTSNFEWGGVRDAELIEQMKVHHADAELIQLTLRDGFVYYK